MYFIDSKDKEFQIFTSEPLTTDFVGLDSVITYFDNINNVLGEKTSDPKITAERKSVLADIGEIDPKNYILKRDLRFMHVVNTDTIEHEVNFLIYNSEDKTDNILFKPLLQPKETAEYALGKWTIYDKDGLKKKEDNTSTTANPSTNVEIGTSSTLIIEENEDRKGLIIQNTGDEDVFLGVGEDAVLNKGIYLVAGGGTWVMDKFTFTTQAINGIVESDITNISVQEFE